MIGMLNAGRSLLTFEEPDDGGGGGDQGEGNPDENAGNQGDQGGDQGDQGGDKDEAGSGDTPAAADPWAEIEDPEIQTLVKDKSPAEIAKELAGAQKLIGKKMIGIPDKDSTPEEQAAFHAARGVPETADDYQLDDLRDGALKDIPEDQRGKFWDKDEEAYYRGLLKSSNISNGEARELFQRELARRTEKATAAVEENATVSKAAADLITEKWGNKEAEYTQDANVFARHLGLDGDAIEVIQDLTGKSAEARFKAVDAMRQMGAMLREGGQPGTTPAAVTAVNMTPEQAQVAKQTYLAQGDNAKAYQEPMHPNHALVTKQVTEYLKAQRGIK